jgi:uncharacterized membrane protein
MRRPISIAVSVLAALALGACGGAKSNPDSHPTLADTASNFTQPFDARGADPDWGLKIRGQQIVLARPGLPDMTGVASGATIKAHSASWAAALPNRQIMTVSLYASACTDAQSGATYAFSAEVVPPDATPLSGCAGPPAAAAGKR